MAGMLMQIRGDYADRHFMRIPGHLWPKHRANAGVLHSGPQRRSRYREIKNVRKRSISASSSLLKIAASVPRGLGVA